MHPIPEPCPALVDDVMVLRPMLSADAAAHVAGEDEASRRWLNEGHASTVEGTSRWIEENARMWRNGGPRLTFGIRDAVTDELMGMAEVNTDFDALGLLPGEANISYQVYARYRGRGVATGAVRLLLEHLQTMPSVRVAAIQTDPNNPSSARVAAKAGFHVNPGRRGKDGMTVHTKSLHA